MAKHTHLFHCSCDSDKEGKSFEDFKKHLAEVHDLDPKGLKGKRQMVMHVDGTKFYSSTYEWTLENGLKFTEFIESERTKKTMLY